MENQTNRPPLKKYPLTSYQNDIWLKHIMNPGKPLCNLGAFVEIVGEFDPAKMERAVNRAIIENLQRGSGHANLLKI